MRSFPDDPHLHAGLMLMYDEHTCEYYGLATALPSTASITRVHPAGCHIYPVRSCLRLNCVIVTRETSRRSDTPCSRIVPHLLVCVDLPVGKPSDLSAKMRPLSAPVLPQGLQSGSSAHFSYRAHEGTGLEPSLRTLLSYCDTD